MPVVSSTQMLYLLPAYSDRQHVLQVALLSGLDTDGQKKLSGSKDSDHHLNKLLRLLTVRTETGRGRSGIALVGGPHDAKVDGSVTQR